MYVLARYTFIQYIDRNKILHLAIPLAVLVLIGTVASVAAEPYVDSVTFTRVGDDTEAVEAVRNGTLDIYYYSVPYHLIGDTDNLVLHSVPAGGSLSLLLNPAEGDKFNPFQIQAMRFAVNYMVDREGIVEEMLGGYGAPMVSPFAPHDSDYITTLEQSESFAISYNPDLAKSIIAGSMTREGAVMEDGVWVLDGEPVQVTLFIRDDDPLRSAIGESVAVHLEDAGFVVERTYGNLALAYDVVYGADPSNLEWHIYTEGWGSSFSADSDSSLAIFYAPWTSNLPGHNNPEFWNYKHDKLDQITQTIYNDDYTDEEHRTDLVQQATVLGMYESVRVFLVAQADTFISNENVKGVINHISGGISHSLTLTNVQTPSDELKIGVRLLSQSSWNPVSGFGDVYSGDIAGPMGIPSAIGHPHTGNIIPHAVERHAVTAGPDGTMEAPSDAFKWDPYEQQWVEAGENATAITKVTLNYTFSNWHHGQAADINDIIYLMYFEREWGTITGEDDTTWDSEYTQAVSSSPDIMVGVKQVDDDTIDVYIDYWHFSPTALSSAGVWWLSVPWEILYAMENVVSSGQAKFSDTDALANEVSWLSVLDTDDVALIRAQLVSFLEEGSVPKSLEGMDPEYYSARYQAAISWIDRYGHAAIDNGPFMLESHDEEAGIAVLTAFRDETYPYSKGVWSDFSAPIFPTIIGISKPSLESGEAYSFDVFNTNTDTLRYFLSHNTGEMVHSGEINATGTDTITIPAEATIDVNDCSLALRVFALSEAIIIPDTYKTAVDVNQCGTSLEERLEELGVTGEVEFLRTLAGVIQTAMESDDTSIEDIMTIVDDEELSEASIILLTIILGDGVDADSLFEYLQP